MSDYLIDKEKELELSFVSNYIVYTAQLIAGNINSIYKCYENDYSLSYEDIIRMSKDEYILSNNENKLFHDKIKQCLKEKYSIEIISDAKENIKFRKLWGKYGKR